MESVPMDVVYETVDYDDGEDYVNPEIKSEVVVEQPASDAPANLSSLLDWGLNTEESAQKEEKATIQKYTFFFRSLEAGPDSDFHVKKVSSLLDEDTKRFPCKRNGEKVFIAHRKAEEKPKPKSAPTAATTSKRIHSSGSFSNAPPDKKPKREIIKIKIPQSFEEFMDMFFDMGRSFANFNVDPYITLCQNALQKFPEIEQYDDLEHFRQTHFPRLFSDLWNTWRRSQRENTSTFLGVVTSASEINDKTIINCEFSRSIHEPCLIKFGMSVHLIVQHLPADLKLVGIVRESTMKEVITNVVKDCVTIEIKTPQDTIKWMNKPLKLRLLTNIRSTICQARGLTLENSQLLLEIVKPNLHSLSNGLPLNLHHSERKYLEPFELDAIQKAMDTFLLDYESHFNLVSRICTIDLNRYYHKTFEYPTVTMLRQLKLLNEASPTGFDEFPIILTIHDGSVAKSFIEKMKEIDIKVVHIADVGLSLSPTEKELNEAAKEMIAKILNNPQNYATLEKYELTPSILRSVHAALDDNKQTSIETALKKEIFLKKAKIEMIMHAHVIIGKIDDICNDEIFSTHISMEDGKINRKPHIAIINDAHSIPDLKLCSLLNFGIQRLILLGKKLDNIDNKNPSLVHRIIQYYEQNRHNYTPGVRCAIVSLFKQPFLRTPNRGYQRGSRSRGTYNHRQPTVSNSGYSPYRPPYRTFDNNYQNRHQSSAGYRSSHQRFTGYRGRRNS